MRWWRSQASQYHTEPRNELCGERSMYVCEMCCCDVFPSSGLRRQLAGTSESSSAYCRSSLMTHVSSLVKGYASSKEKRQCRETSSTFYSPRPSRPSFEGGRLQSGAQSLVMLKGVGSPPDKGESERQWFGQVEQRPFLTLGCSEAGVYIVPCSLPRRQISCSTSQDSNFDLP